MLEKDFLSTRVIAISRGISGPSLEKLIQALEAGGIRLAEVTLNSPDALNSIYRLRQKFGKSIHIGAGTVLNLNAAKEAVGAGAEFIVTPNIDREVIEYCVSKNILIVPGALTPSEIMEAIKYGSRYVKMFPIKTMGAEYLKDVLSSLSEAKIVAVGGINTANAADFIANGAVGLGVGGNLCRIPEDGDYGKISAYAKELLAICRPHK